MGRRDGSSRPEPRPVVPRMIPRMYFSEERRWISATTLVVSALKGRVAKAKRRPGYREHRELTSLLMLIAVWAASVEGTQSSQGFARDCGFISIQYFF